MKVSIVSSAPLVLLVLALSAPAALATRAGVPQEAGAPQEMVFDGQIVQVDANSQSLIAQDAAGETTLFYFTEETEISGEVDNVQGLSGRTGAQLRITYQPQGEINVATRVEVLSNPEP